MTCPPAIYSAPTINFFSKNSWYAICSMRIFYFLFYPRQIQNDLPPAIYSAFTINRNWWWVSPLHSVLFIRQKWYVSFAKKPCKRDYILQKRPINLRSPIFCIYHQQKLMVGNTFCVCFLPLMVGNTSIAGNVKIGSREHILCLLGTHSVFIVYRWWWALHRFLEIWKKDCLQCES